MRTHTLILPFALLAGCNCPVETGDTGKYRDREVMVRAIEASGSASSTCYVGVIYADGGPEAMIPGWAIELD